MSPIISKLAWKCAPFIALSLGLALTVWLVSTASVAAVAHSLGKVGWGAAVVVAVRATMIAINGIAWSRLLSKLSSAPVTAFLLARWIREAVDVLLPAAYIGGGLVGARILTFWRTSTAVAFAGAVADLFLQTVAQALFALLGAFLLLRIMEPGAVLPRLTLGLTIAVIALGGFYAAQRYGGARLVDRALAALSSRTTYGAKQIEPDFQITMQTIWKNRRSPVLTSMLMHLCAWMFGTLEVWVTLYFMGWRATLMQAVIIESLGVSISIAAFIIPGSWGIQEAGYILVGQMLGVPTQLSLTLSLVKRIPDFALGIPGLVVWHAFEARRLLFG